MSPAIRRDSAGDSERSRGGRPCLTAPRLLNLPPTASVAFVGVGRGVAHVEGAIRCHLARGFLLFLRRQVGVLLAELGHHELPQLLELLDLLLCDLQLSSTHGGEKEDRIGLGIPLTRYTTGPHQSFHSLCGPSLPAQGYAPRPLTRRARGALLMFC